MTSAVTDFHNKSMMQVASLISLLALASQQVVALTRRGAPVHAQDLLECTFMVHFPIGTNGEQVIHDHFAAHNIDYTVRVSHSDNFDSFVSFQIQGDDCDTSMLDGIPGAIHYSNVRELSAPVPTDFTSGPTVVPSTQDQIHSITGVKELRNTGITGKGIKVAVIDSGVYYLHPALGGGIGPNFKVLKGYDFVGNDYNGQAATLKPSSDPLDNCSKESHGTHVAGIIAADARNIVDPKFTPTFPFTGVAPEANLLAYRVFACEGKTGNDIITKAILMAANDGADVINLSLGGGPAYNDEPQDLAVDKVTAAGHFVIASAGNDGASGIFTTGNPSNARTALSIASFDNVEAPYQTITVDGAPFIYNLGSNNANFTVGQTLDVIVNDLEADVKDVQNDGLAGVQVNAAGKALVLRWGDSSLGGSVARCTAAFKAGAAACILYNNGPSMFSIGGSSDIPSLLTSSEGGKAIIAAFKAGKAPKVIFTQDKILSKLATAGTISDFSSGGIDLDLNVKPDVGGIGGQVLSTISPHSAEANGYTEKYAVMSGTSMSSPYVAGATALILQARKKNVNFNQLRGYIQNNARATSRFSSELTESVVFQGSGLINAFYAATSKSLVLPSAIALNDTDNFVASSKFTVTNQDSVPVTYSFITRGAATVNPYMAGDDFTQDKLNTRFTDDDQNTKITFDKKSVTVAPGASADITISASSPTAAVPNSYPIYSGYIVVQASNQPDHEISIPYAGMIGSYKNKPIWTRNSPSLAKRWAVAKKYSIPVQSVRAGLFDTFFKPLSEGYKFNATAGAFLLAPASANSRDALVELVPQENATIKSLNDAGFDPTSVVAIARDIVTASRPLYYWADRGLKRNTFADGQSVLAPLAYAFNGYAFTAAGKLGFVPAGSYKMKFSALRNFASVGSTNPADYDIVETAAFNLFYADTPQPSPSPSISSSKASPSASAISTSSTSASTAATSTSVSSSVVTSAISSGASVASSTLRSVSPSVTATESASAAPSGTATGSTSATPSGTATGSASAAPSGIATGSASAAPSGTATGSASAALSGTATGSAATGSASAAPSSTASADPSASASAYMSPASSAYVAPATTYAVSPAPVSSYAPPKPSQSNLYKSGVAKNACAVLAGFAAAVFIL
ncbi:hypothetical protein BC830DRAFT_1215136 [Chytriomyces sp. MP71]|nr:hypothetical protein BC830DRAFT_1215136 [Chytriomyces sp. MP71]